MHMALLGVVVALGVAALLPREFFLLDERPDLAPHGRVERALAVFYTWTLGGSALATPLLYGPLGDAVGPRWAAVAAAAIAVVPITFVLSPRLARK